MMRELFRHEYLSTRKPLAVIAGWLCLVGFVGLIPAAVPIPIVGPVSLVIAIVCFVGLTPALLGYLIFSYWHTMYGRLGYFTMTIPVRGRMIYWTKVLYALMVVAAGIVVSAASLAVATFANDIGSRLPIGTTLGSAWEVITEIYGTAALPLTLIIIVQIVLFVLALPAVMSISAQARFNHLGVGAPIIGAILLYLTYQLTSLVAMMFIPIGIFMGGPNAGKLVAEGMWDSVVKAVPAQAEEAMPDVLGLGMLITATLLTVWLVWWGIRSIERRTSLR
ncbi:hypothetical protein [Ancrocorticia populi]|uniref:hypothetical protein n=2 Tax=Ancrocorticia populi TaxID=2175228 RepID=UPI003F8F9670